ncbi:hypothetical protein BZA70DRAFT_292252 [Myxozyma melibiosi]|uniref:Zn(2)-C6 fungal-type domain-containing protein n=1 Tax=Myxozyma melibiosi TaxID=54550 RepID=A0ABR1EY00_9ASCO
MARDRSSNNGIITRRRIDREPRSRSGCLTCRARHKRCDQRMPSCSNCNRLNLKCEGYKSVLRWQARTMQSVNIPDSTYRSVRYIVFGQADYRDYSEEVETLLDLYSQMDLLPDEQEQHTHQVQQHIGSDYMPCHAVKDDYSSPGTIPLATPDLAYFSAFEDSPSGLISPPAAIDNSSSMLDHSDLIYLPDAAMPATAPAPAAAGKYEPCWLAALNGAAVDGMLTEYADHQMEVMMPMANPDFTAVTYI